MFEAAIPITILAIGLSNGLKMKNALQQNVMIQSIGSASGVVVAGDLTQPLQSGALDLNDIAGDLYDLCRSRHAGRTSDDEITLFKSAGAGLEDLAGALLAYEQARR